MSNGIIDPVGLSRSMLSEITPGTWCEGEGSYVYVPTQELPPPTVAMGDTEEDRLHYHGRLICESVGSSNRLFISMAPWLVRELCEEVERLKKALRGSPWGVPR